MTRHSVNNNTRMDHVISLCLNSNHLISLIPLKLPHILDIRELKQTDAAAERRRLTSNFLFKRSHNQVNSFGP